MGYGVDTPVRGDLADTQIAQNETYFANLIWEAIDNLQISFEVDYRKTDFVTFRDADGVVFLTEFLCGSDAMPVVPPLPPSSQAHLPRLRVRL